MEGLWEGRGGEGTDDQRWGVEVVRGGRGQGAAGEEAVGRGRLIRGIWEAVGNRTGEGRGDVSGGDDTVSATGTGEHCR